jgi:hypothetical protein
MKPRRVGFLVVGAGFDSRPPRRDAVAEGS